MFLVQKLEGGDGMRGQPRASHRSSPPCARDRGAAALDDAGGCAPDRALPDLRPQPGDGRGDAALGAAPLGRSLSVGLREREIVIDRTCARCGCEYEWGVHVAFFAVRAGFDDAQLLDLLLLWGWYHAISFTARAARVPLENGAPTFDSAR